MAERSIYNLQSAYIEFECRRQRTDAGFRPDQQWTNDFRLGRLEGGTE